MLKCHVLNAPSHAYRRKSILEGDKEVKSKNTVSLIKDWTQQIAKSHDSNTVKTGRSNNEIVCFHILMYE